MTDEENILDIIYHSIDNINESLPNDKKIEKSTQTVLFGDSGGLESLELTLLIVAIEQNIEKELGKHISLVDATRISAENSPFQSIDLLKEHIKNLV